MINDQRDLQAKLMDLEARTRQLNAEDQALNQKADDLENRIRIWALEIAQLKEKKRQLEEETKALQDTRSNIEEEARTIGEKRTRCAQERQILSQEKDMLNGQINQTPGPSVKHNAPEAAAIKPGAGGEKQPIFAEHRNGPRCQVDVDISFDTEHNFYTGLSENISEGGVFVATRDDLKVGTEMDLTIKLPNSIQIYAEGIVRWVREYNEFTADFAPGVGVQFTNLSHGNRCAIENFIRNRAPLLYEVE